MDANTIMQGIQTVGFPIVMVILMGWYINKKDNSHKEELNALRNTIESNTKILSKLESLMSMLIERRRETNDTRRI